MSSPVPSRRPSPPPDFYEIQKRQKRKSYAVLGALLAVYVAAIGFLMLAVYFTLAVSFIALVPLASWPKFLLTALALATIIAVFHFKEARANGAGFILRRLEAAPPDPADRYHLAFLNVVQEIRLSAGLPGVEAFILPTLAVNSLALIKPEGTPCVVVTEGMLAEFSRDELEAVVSHELAHIARGDAIILTLVCSLANFFERFRTGIEPELESDERRLSAPGHIGGQSGLLFVAATLASAIVRIMSFFVSRERELLADAAAVELGRSPDALARAIYKAAVYNSFVGDFSETYAPLFIVAPESHADPGPRRPRWASSHPPLGDRLEALAAMVHKPVRAIIADVDRARAARNKAKKAIPAASELGLPTALPSAADPRKEWTIEAADATAHGPFSLEELLFFAGFRPSSKVTNSAEGITARAWDFPQVREGLRRIRQGRAANPERLNRCPRCKIPLSEVFYEGVPVKACRTCLGKLIHQAEMDRVLARREVGFSKALLAKAEEFRQKYILKPENLKRETKDSGKVFLCPNCGYGMKPRPYNYQYLIPVDKCLSCGEIWFDADEVEMLQALVEQARGD
jgi:Zn-dependent protease with chaperone function/Zn-finger nucleic acid-binding protein